MPMRPQDSNPRWFVASMAATCIFLLVTRSGLSDTSMFTYFLTTAAGVLIIIAIFWNEFSRKFVDLSRSIAGFANDARAWFVLLFAGLGLVTYAATIRHYDLRGDIDFTTSGNTENAIGTTTTGKTVNMFLKTGVVITIGATVRNLGRPTIIENYKLDVEYDGHSSPTESIKIPPGEIKIFTPKETVVFQGRDALYDKTGSASLESGGLARGLLFFVLPDAHADDLVSGAKLTLSFEDVSGKQYYATMVTSRDKETGPRYEPGLSIEVIPKE
jgi:hypothetical protein